MLIRLWHQGSDFPPTIENKEDGIGAPEKFPRGWKRFPGEPPLRFGNSSQKIQPKPVIKAFWENIMIFLLTFRKNMNYEGKMTHSEQNGAQKKFQELLPLVPRKFPGFAIKVLLWKRLFWLTANLKFPENHWVLRRQKLYVFIGQTDEKITYLIRAFWTLGNRSGELGEPVVISRWNVYF